MEWPRMRFTIRNLMIAVMVVAGLLALPSGWRELAALIATVGITLLGSRRMLAAGRKHLAGSCFWALAISANVLYAAGCIVPSAYLPELLCLGWFFFLLPPLAGLGSAWAILAARDVTADRPRRSGAWAWVVALTLMPPATALTLWPFRLTVLAAWPALDRLADRVAAGQAVTYPVTVGPFRIAASAVDPASGNVGLMIDPDPNGPTAFIRGKGMPGSGPFRCYRPVRGDTLDIRLGNGWCYHIED